MKRGNVILISFLIAWAMVSHSGLYAQLETKGSPVLANLKSPTADIPIIEVVAPESQDETHDNIPLKIMRVAKALDVNIDLTKNGKWTLSDNKKICQLGIRSPGAKNIGLLFSLFEMPPGAELFVYNSGLTDIKGAYTNQNNKVYNTFTIQPVEGEIVFIHLQLPEDYSIDATLVVGQIFAGLDDEKTTAQAYQSDYCHYDINCYPNIGIQQVKNSVCKILAGGLNLCTGTLINSTANDGKAYLLTANHCIQDEATANNSIFYFGYEAPYCGGPLIPASKTLSGSRLVATSTRLDFTLVELTEYPPLWYNPYFAGWSLDTSIAGTIGIHHPQGDIKKISEDYHSPVISDFGTKFDPQSFWRVLVWDVGTTEEGSSGSPLFFQNRLVGTLTGGYADCSSPENDYYARFDKVWDKYPATKEQLKHWLDPVNTGQKILNGQDPYVNIKENNYSLTNVEEGQVTLIRTGSWGYASGHNATMATVFSEKFFTEDKAALLGFHLNVAKAKKRSQSGRILFYVWDGPPENNNVLYSTYLPVDYFQENTYNYFGLERYVAVEHDFYIGYRVFYTVIADTFALFTANPYDNVSKNTALAYRDISGWDYLKNQQGQSVYTSLDIKPVLNNSEILIDVPKITQFPEITIFPNPAKDKINILAPSEGWFYIEIFDTNGKVLYLNNTIEKRDNLYNVDISGFVNGVYIVRLTCRDAVYIKKFLVRH